MLKQTIYLFIKATVVGVLINVGIASMPVEAESVQVENPAASEVVTTLE